MKVEFRKADTADAELLIDIYNSSFYDDYMKYGECPAYGKTQEMMRQSIIDYSKFLILYNGRPVGCISCKEAEKGIYEVGCLCIIPEFQGKGIGTAAMEFAKSYCGQCSRNSDIHSIVPGQDECEIRKPIKKKRLFPAADRSGQKKSGPISDDLIQ